MCVVLVHKRPSYCNRRICELRSLLPVLFVVLLFCWVCPTGPLVFRVACVSPGHVCHPVRPGAVWADPVLCGLCCTYLELAYNCQLINSI